MGILLMVAFSLFGLLGLISIMVFVYRLVANLFYKEEYKVKTTGIDKTGVWRS